MKHHIFHKSYRHIHVISLTVAVIIAGVWVHISTQKANSEIKLGVSVRDIGTLNSADIGRTKEVAPAPATSEAAPSSDGSGGGDRSSNSGSDSNGATSLSLRVKSLLGISAPASQSAEKTSTDGSSGGVVADAAVDPCLALVQANQKGVFVQKGATYVDGRLETIKNPCSQLPTSLLPCAANYAETAATTRLTRPKPEAFHFIPRAEAETDTPPPAEKVESKPTEKSATERTSPCTFAEGSTAKASLRKTLLDNLDALLPNVTLQVGDTGSNVELLQNIIALSAGSSSEKMFKEVGVFDKGMREQISKFQDRLNAKLSLDPKLKTDGIYNAATRAAFVTVLRMQIDEFLSVFKDTPIVADDSATEPSLLTSIDLDKTIPIVIKETKSETEKEKTATTFTGDPCLVLTPNLNIAAGVYMDRVYKVQETNLSARTQELGDKVSSPDVKSIAINLKEGAPFNPCGNIPTQFLPCAANYEIDPESMTRARDLIDGIRNQAKNETVAADGTKSSDKNNLRQSVLEAINTIQVVSNHSVPACHFIAASSAPASLVKTLIYYIGLAIPEGTTFKLGDSGDSVMYLQQLLNAFGEDLDKSGTYDESTVEFVTKFQQTIGLKADGSFGGETRKAFLTILNKVLNRFIMIYRNKNDVLIDRTTPIPVDPTMINNPGFQNKPAQVESTPN